jgi:hypothetical protein
MSDQDNQQPEELSEELARKYDPERLLRLVSKRAGKGESLDHSIRAKYEKRFGVDLGHVRIYTGEFAEEFNRRHSAHAVTVGSTGMILMGNSPDKSMGAASGQALLAHELTHVAQAQRGLHRKATGDMPFTSEHEAEAEAVEHSVASAGGDHGADTRAAADAASKANADKEAMVQAIAKIKERAHELVADAIRNDILRNGLQRRA